MRNKLSQSLVFFSVGVTLLVGGVGTYHLVFAEKPELPHLKIGVSTLIPEASLLSNTPYSVSETREAENRVRTRSPAFQSESTQLEVKPKKR